MGYLLKLGMACGVCLVLLLPGRAEPPAPVDYLVLKNGAVLTGRVVKEEQTYVLRSIASTGESRYQAKMVAKVCSNPLELYQFFKQSLRPDDVDDHCRLASLCLKYGLMQEAKVEIDEALKCDRHSPEAISLLKQHSARQKETAAAPEVPALPSAAIPPMPPASLEDWSLAATPPAMQVFSQRIQPMLMMGCGTGACHGVPEGKRAFILRRGLVGVPLSPLMTKTNFERVLALVDREKPASSELLKRAVQPHGNSKHWPVTVEHQAVLKQWVNYVTGNTELARIESPAEEKLPKTVPNTFAAGNDSSVLLTPAKSDADASTNKLPTILGMSGAAIQQTGGTVPARAKETATSPPAPSPAGLPAIPGVSGKAQTGSGASPLPVPLKDTSSVPRSQVAPDETEQFNEYVRRMGLARPLPENKQQTPQQMRIVNAGSFRVDTPPVQALAEELREQLKRQEEARKSEGKDKDGSSSSPAFMRQGTIVNTPPR